MRRKYGKRRGFVGTRRMRRSFGRRRRGYGRRRSVSRVRTNNLRPGKVGYRL